MSDARKLILVFGAHRSGTSLCAAAVASLGADACLGDHYANEENRKGFFEHPDVVDFNDRLLAYLGGSWDNPLFDGGSALAAHRLDQWYGEGARLLGGIYGGAPVAVLKDPRLCQLLPFWARLCNRAGYSGEQIYCIHTLRDPVEVALSQQKRATDNPAFYEFGGSLAEGAALWLSLTAQAVQQGAALNTLYVAYSRLLAHTGEELSRLGQFLGLSPEARSLENFSRDFVDPTLYRSTADEAVRTRLQQELPQAGEVYRALQPLLSGGDGTALQACRDICRREDTRRALCEIASPAFSRLSTRCRADSLDLQQTRETVVHLEQQTREMAENTDRMRREHRAVLEPLREQLGRLEAGNAALQSQLSEQAAEYAKLAEESRRSIHELLDRAGRLEQDKLQLTGEVENLHRQVQEILASTSWRITRPLRSLSARWQRLRGWQARKWAQFRLRAILIYHRMSLRHARLAYAIRRLVRPLFQFMNRVSAGAAADVRKPVDGVAPAAMRYQQSAASDDYAPLVSVLVPNYNHAPYLRLRLDSIFSQTYRNFEVILLDDASTDNSAEILRDYHRRHAERSTLVVNEQNSGGVFHQWERGLDLARGNIVWIAESDDWCTENFLETLVPFFENEAVQIAYARTVFMDGEGDRQIWSINEYLHDIDAQRWNHTILETGPAIVREAFAVKNIIPNVSSALLRTPRQLEILSDPEWRTMRTCGDWVLYLHLLRGGMLAYAPQACNYYRIHGRNTSVESYAEDEFYREHETVARTVQRYFDVPPEALAQLQENLAIHWRQTRGGYSAAALERCFSLQRIQAAAGGRAPNLLMASYAFCAGGGETLPINLANVMKRHGYNVTYLDCAQEPRVEGVRQKLRPDIPVVSDFAQVERIVADFAIDIVHSHHAWVDNTILDLLPENTDCKTIVTLHGMYETINDYELRPILPRLVKRSACLIYVAEKNLEAIRRHRLLQHANLARIDNALECEQFTPISRDSLGIPADAFVLALVSRGLVEKGWAEAIEITARARQTSGRDIHLLLVGDGPEYERLQACELPEYVHLEGFQRNVRGYFAMADAGILPSRFRGESFPLVIIECLQCGVPFLASDLGEISRMLDGAAGRAGFVIPLAGNAVDLDAWHRQLADLVCDEEKYRAMTGAADSAMQKFDPDLMASRHDEVYRNALQRDATAATSRRQAVVR